MNLPISAETHLDEFQNGEPNFGEGADFPQEEVISVTRELISCCNADITNSSECILESTQDGQESQDSIHIGNVTSTQLSHFKFLRSLKL